MASNRAEHIAVVLVLVLSATCMSLGQYSGGDGSPGSPYRISSAEDLNSIGEDPNDWDKHFLLVSDIDMSDFAGAAFNIIGNDVNHFKGVFDGENHTIENFTYEANDVLDVGIFGHVGDVNAVIKNVTLFAPDVNAGGVSRFVGSLVGYLERGTVECCGVDGGSIKGFDSVGGLVGENLDGVISNCYASASVTGLRFYTGGLAGYNLGTISNCWARAFVSGHQDTGGLVGFNRAGDIIRCFAAGLVTADDYFTGGLAGTNQLGTISACYTIGDVLGVDITGGLVGSNELYGEILDCYSRSLAAGFIDVGGLAGLNYEGSISRSYAAGPVSGTGHVGGLVGCHAIGSYDMCFWDSDVNPMLAGIGNFTDPNVIAKTTAEMKLPATFTDAGWDFVGETENGTDDYWDIWATWSYPRLSWQLDYVNPDGLTWGDFAFFANHWAQTNCSDSNDCDGTDLDLSGEIDWRDLRIFFQKWLMGAK